MSTHRPPHDPELDAALTVTLENLPGGGVSEEALTVMRDSGAALLPGLSDEELATAGIVRTDLSVQGYEGVELKASTFARTDHSAGGPGIYFIHGGGMITGHRLLGVQQALPWVIEHDAVLLTVDYRLAPEDPDPYPVEDCYAGLVWMAEHAEELGFDAARLLITGASAGGGLTAGTTLLARDRKAPTLIGQALICPMIDDRDATVSSQQVEDHTTWSRKNNRQGWRALLGDRVGTDDVSIYAAPARATDLAGLPPTFIDCGSSEVFRDEDVAYASRLWEAGNDTELHVWAGGFHGFDMLAPHAAVSQAAVAARDSWVARRFGDA